MFLWFPTQCNCFIDMSDLMTLKKERERKKKKERGKKEKEKPHGLSFLLIWKSHIYLSLC